MSNRSTKQKEISREQNRLAISRLSIKLRSEFWNLNPSSFQSCEEMPLDFVEFNKSTCRYQYSQSYHKMQQTKKRDLGFTDDDAIAQSMVVYLLYRMEKGWGNQRSYQALPIWGGKPAKKDQEEDDPFPLENLWEEEIKELIASKKLGMTSLNHFDNFDSFTRLYDNGVVKDRWSRRSSSYLSRVHELGEQATIQMALYLHEHVSHHYATLAGAIIHHALGGGIDDPHIMPQLAQCLIQTARTETDTFPKAAYELIEYFGQNEQDNTEDMRSSSTTSSKRQRIVNE